MVHPTNVFKNLQISSQNYITIYILPSGYICIVPHIKSQCSTQSALHCYSYPSRISRLVTRRSDIRETNKDGWESAVWYKGRRCGGMMMTASWKMEERIRTARGDEFYSIRRRRQCATMTMRDMWRPPEWARHPCPKEK
jgi:hypothetical protein